MKDKNACNSKQTSPSVASKASSLLSNPNTPKSVKSVAASDLAQTRSNHKRSGK